MISSITQRTYFPSHYPRLLRAKKADGWLPLHCASCSGHAAVVQLMLENGADVHAVVECNQ
jgi:ankyrin repeat protein